VLGTQPGSKADHRSGGTGVVQAQAAASDASRCNGVITRRQVMEGTLSPGSSVTAKTQTPWKFAVSLVPGLGKNHKQ
jgi:hypothetical protein